MTYLPDTVSLLASVFVQGLALSLGLIVAIGAQNAFVLRQGLRREHVGSVVWLAGLWRPLAGAMVCPATGLAGIGRFGGADDGGYGHPAGAPCAGWFLSVSGLWPAIYMPW